MPALNISRMWLMELRERLDPQIVYEVERLRDIHDPKLASSDHSMSVEQHELFARVVAALAVLDQVCEEFLTVVTPEMAKAAAGGRKDGDPAPQRNHTVMVAPVLAPSVATEDEPFETTRVGGIEVRRPRGKR
jgi:hypothetical protein